VAASSGRAPKIPRHERKTQLEKDEWTLEVEENRVRCKGCTHWIKLYQIYDLRDWRKHKDSCAAITGEVKIRVRKETKPPVNAVSVQSVQESIGSTEFNQFNLQPRGVSVIGSFFKPAARHAEAPIPEVSTSTVPIRSKGKQAIFEESQLLGSTGISYVTKTVKAVSASKDRPLYRTTEH
jgi:hypothetical protein